MKKFLGFLIALMFVMPVASQAVEFEIAGEQIVAGVQTPATKSSPPTKPKLAVVAPAPAKYAGPTLRQISAEFSRQVTALEKKSAEDKVAREADVNNTLGTVNDNVVMINENLTGKKGEFAKLGEKVDAVPSTFGGMFVWLFIGIVIALALTVVVIVLVLKKDIKAVPEKTTEQVIEASVNASQPDCFVVKIDGRSFSYTYQADGSVLFVRDDGNIAKFTDRNQANRSLLSTFKHLSFNQKGEIKFTSMSDQQAAIIKDAITKGILKIA
jgi:hypothetical protein